MPSHRVIVSAALLCFKCSSYRGHLFPSCLLSLHPIIRVTCAHIDTREWERLSYHNLIYIYSNVLVCVTYSSLSSTCTPYSSNIWTTSSIPLVDATWSGVLPFLSFTSALAPRSSNKRAVVVWPSDDARCNGVHPSLSSAFAFASRSSNKRTISV